ncbi:MAG: hypothetical protein FWC50_10260 [Planctomycetaceae bacterium]|nr:hypothetical protein [Planctomycetaceae bacterium]
MMMMMRGRTSVLVQSGFGMPGCRTLVPRKQASHIHIIVSTFVANSNKKMALIFVRLLNIIVCQQVIPQSVWTAAFGLAQPPCIVGLPYSSSGISHRFEYNFE